MKWYGVSLIFKSVIHEADQLSDDLCEQQIRLIQAEDDTLALEWANELGRKLAHKYHNEAQQMVEWVFVGVESIQELFEDDLSDGVEIYSRFFEHSSPQNLLPKFESTQLAT